MTIKQFLAQNIDIDVYDDTVEELGVAFVGPQVLTPTGVEHFKPIFDLVVDVFNNCAIIHLSDEGWEGELDLCKELFLGSAGFIPNSLYDKWFAERSRI